MGSCEKISDREKNGSVFFDFFIKNNHLVRKNFCFFLGLDLNCIRSCFGGTPSAGMAVQQRVADKYYSQMKTSLSYLLSDRFQRLEERTFGKVL